MNHIFIFVNICWLVYLVDKVLVSRVVGGDDGEYVPIILLHDVQHDRGLLLDGRSKLEKHGVVVLETREPINKQGHESYSARDKTGKMIMEHVQLLRGLRNEHSLVCS